MRRVLYRRSQTPVHDFYDLPVFRLVDFGHNLAEAQHCILVIHSRSSLGCQTNGLPFLVGEETADVRRFRYRPLDSLTDGWRLHRLPSQPSGHPRQFIIGIKHRHEVDQVAHDGCLVAFATQLVVDAVQTLCGRVDALPAVSFHDDCAPLNDEPSEQGRYGSNV